MTLETGVKSEFFKAEFFSAAVVLKSQHAVLVVCCSSGWWSQWDAKKLDGCFLEGIQQLLIGVKNAPFAGGEAWACVKMGILPLAPASDRRKRAADVLLGSAKVGDRDRAVHSSPIVSENPPVGVRRSCPSSYCQIDVSHTFSFRDRICWAYAGKVCGSDPIGQDEFLKWNERVFLCFSWNRIWHFSSTASRLW